QRSAFAMAATAWAWGCRCGIPGLRTSAVGMLQSTTERSRKGMPARTASARLEGSSSHAQTIAPERARAIAAVSPDLARPKTATVRPACSGSGIICSPELEGCKPGQRQDRGYDPEADHDRRFGPSLLLEVMMQRRHAKHAATGQLEGDDLHDHRCSFEHEQP